MGNSLPSPSNTTMASKHGARQPSSLHERTPSRFMARFGTYHAPGMSSLRHTLVLSSAQRPSVPTCVAERSEPSAVSTILPLTAMSESGTKDALSNETVLLAIESQSRW